MELDILVMSVSIATSKSQVEMHREAQHEGISYTFVKCEYVAKKMGTLGTRNTGKSITKEWDILVTSVNMLALLQVILRRTRKLSMEELDHCDECEYVASKETQAS